jgi:hypothetical protein
VFDSQAVVPSKTKIKNKLTFILVDGSSNSQVLSGSQWSETIDMIPVRATIISAIFVLPYNTFYFLFQAVDIDPVLKAGAIGVVLSVITILRCPLTAFVTYKTRMEIASARRKFIERQERQGLEIQNAIMKRNGRKKSLNDVEESAF